MSGVALGTAVIGGALGYGQSNNWWQGDNSFDETTQTNKYERLPDYAEATGARESIWDKLQQWGTQDDYGAIPKNWDDIWGQAQKQVSQYYWGSPTDPGMVGKVQADAARKGQTGQPAYLRNLSRMGKSEADIIAEMAVKQATEKAQFAEQGRQNWLSSMFGLSEQKPTYANTGNTKSSAIQYEGDTPGTNGFDWSKMFTDTVDIFGNNTTDTTKSTAPMGKATLNNNNMTGGLFAEFDKQYGQPYQQYIN